MKEREPPGAIPPQLIRVQRLDSIRLDQTYFTSEGYLVDTPILTSVGIFEYKNRDGSIRHELRLPEEVFSETSLASYEGKPVIITHEAVWVTKDNVDGEIVGTILTKGYQDGDDVRAKIIIHEFDAVKRSGMRELSLGYNLVLDETPGEWNGQPYDAIQTKIMINHLALVSEARAGDQARLNIDGRDSSSAKGVKGMAKPTKPLFSDDELKNTIAAYTARRQHRLDEAGQSSATSAHEDPNVGAGSPGNLSDNIAPPIGATPAEMTPQDKVQMIKDRRDRRDQEGDPGTPEASQGVIAQQDEDISTLLDIIEALQAKQDFDTAAASGPTDQIAAPPVDPQPAAPAAPSATTDAEPGDMLMGNGEGGDEECGGDAPTIILKLDSAMEAQVDAIVKERLKLGRIGDRLNLDGLELMNPMDAKKVIIKKVCPNMRLDGKGMGKTYINAAFDIAVNQINSAKDTDFQRRQMTHKDSKDNRPDFTPPPSMTGKTSADSAREHMIEKMMNGGKEE